MRLQGLLLLWFAATAVIGDADQRLGGPTRRRLHQKYSDIQRLKARLDAFYEEQEDSSLLSPSSDDWQPGHENTEQDNEVLEDTSYETDSDSGEEDYEITSTPASEAETEDLSCPSAMDVLYRANVSEASLDVFRNALRSTGIADLLQDASLQSTIFAPTDSAFEAAAEAYGLSLNQFLHSPILVPIVLNHILGYRFETLEHWGRSTQTTLLGEDVNITVQNLYDAHDGDAWERYDVDNHYVLLETASTSSYLIESDYCNCFKCNVLVHTIDTLILPRITEVLIDSPRVVITLQDEAAEDWYFEIEYPEAASIASTPSASSEAQGSYGRSMLFHGGRELENILGVDKSVTLTWRMASGLSNFQYNING